MSALDRYSVVFVPRSVATELLNGWLLAWTTQFRQPIKQLRAESLALQNAADQMLGLYLPQLQEELSKLRKKLPQPTRENPDPPLDGIEAVKEMESYIREVESLRTLIRSASIPTQKLSIQSTSELWMITQQIVETDQRLIHELQQINPESIKSVMGLLNEREQIVLGM